MERTARLFSKLKLPAGTIRPDQLVKAGWPTAVGARIAAHAKAVWYDEKRLVVEVGAAVWQQQLSTLKGQILARLEQVIGARLVDDIEFRHSPAPAANPQAGRRRSRSRRTRRTGFADPVLRTIYRQQRRRRSA
jgi:predicted nucleic acid-binding Zn ribbon protein